MNLIDNLIKDGWLKTDRIIKAFRTIKRKDFLPEDMKDLAELNQALPIGLGQTISQPLTVAFMMEKLQPIPGDKILDIGSGSGWTTALLSQIVQPKGRVIAIEIVPELKEFGKKNVEKYNFIEKGIAEFICADGTKGYKKEAPFDRILASAALAAAKGGKEDLSSLTSAKSVPQAWKEQLKVGGRIVVPIGTSIWLLVKKSEEEFQEMEFPGFVFVPLISK
jgi:protein-L-isoaspartate(D-aspartate) O-methyltransferase